jgi:hypothetical protein
VATADDHYVDIAAHARALPRSRRGEAVSRRRAGG